MTLCRRTSTPSCSARGAALGSGRTLKAMMTALEAEASSTSVSLMPPTPAWTILTLTFSVLNFSSCSLRASTEPPTSAFRISGSSLTVPPQHGGHRAAAAVELGFQHGAGGRQGGVGAQLLEVGDEQDHLEQHVQVGLLLGGNLP